MTNDTLLYQQLKVLIGHLEDTLNKVDEGVLEGWQKAELEIQIGQAWDVFCRRRQGERRGPYKHKVGEAA